jgi:TolB-like protein
MELLKRQLEICLINYSSKAFCILLILFLAGCASVPERTADGTPAAIKKSRVAVLPLENLSGTRAPINDIRNSLIENLKRRGIEVLTDDQLEKFMARNRMRYVGGLSPDVARAFKSQEGIEAVLITSLELYDETPPPKISLFMRLISTADMPEILWIESIGFSGDDSPGLLSLGEILDPLKLRDKAMGRLVDSLSESLSDHEERSGGKRGAKKFAPKIAYHSPLLNPAGSHSIVVVPFLNASDRKNAGELVALHFAEQMSKTGNFRVIDPGEVRAGLLNLRIIMENGLSLADASGLFSIIDADLIVTGKVFSYQDYRGPIGTPKVDFTAIVIEKKSREVVWSSDSYNQGNDGVFFFDLGQVNNAHAMVSAMVANIIMQMMRG